MAIVVVAWLYYVEFSRPRWHEGGPFWQALYENAGWPGGIGIVSAIIGLMQKDRRRSLSIVAIAIIVLAYIVLAPPENFA